MAQDGTALAVAGRIEVSVLPKLIRRRGTYPELGHAEWSQSLAIGGLQESRSTALAGTCGRNGRGKELGQRLLFAQGIEERELTEKPLLQGLAALLPFRLQAHDLFLPLSQGGFAGTDALLPCPLQAAVLGLLMLALADELKPHPVFPRGGDALAQGIALCLAALHEVLVCRKLFLHLSAKHGCVLFLLLGCGQERCNLSVDVADGSLFLLEVTAGLHEVEDRRHEVLVLRLAVERAGEGSKERKPSSVGDYQHPEHLAVLQLVVPFSATVDIAAHFAGCCQAQRMGLVAERIGELFGKRPLPPSPKGKGM